jgi:surfactin synthase thioesterase subunit
MDKQKKVKLVCLPYAGGSAMMYKAWIDRFADTAEIVQPELPGRGASIP